MKPENSATIYCHVLSNKTYMHLKNLILKKRRYRILPRWYGQMESFEEIFLATTCASFSRTICLHMGEKNYLTIHSVYGSDLSGRLDDIFVSYIFWLCFWSFMCINVFASCDISWDLGNLIVGYDMSRRSKLLFCVVSFGQTVGRNCFKDTGGRIFSL